VLATLHLPPSWYPEAVFRPGWPNVWLNPVSRAQGQSCPPCPRLLAPIENGVPVAALQARHGKHGYAMVLGRICPEKGVHLAIDAAKHADIPLLIAGEVFAYEAHERYFHEEVEPRLDRRRRYLGPIGFARKRRLLTAARCLLVPSLAPETSSLVAREALACGTPVIAFPNGALPETVDHGHTGFLVRTVEEMAAAICQAQSLTPARCREVAAERFSLEAMTGRYIELYRQLLDESAAMPGAA
jgi:glycosyltransferase involved in cell wall biosynthesis